MRILQERPRSVVVDGSTGFVVGAEDADAMADRVARLVDEPGLRRTMGEAARVRCAERFSIAAVGTAWTRLLAPLVPPTATTRD